MREDAMRIPSADTVLLEGDKILAITSVNNKGTLEALLGHKC
jgi:Trk K+ transport system NAD-binding subunit